MNSKCFLVSMLSFALTLVVQSKAGAVSPGFYVFNDKTPECKEIARVFEQANSTLYCKGIDTFAIKGGKRDLARRQVLKELESTTPKELLLISFENIGWCRKLLPSGSRFTAKQIETYNKAIRKLSPFVRKLGYKRVFMVTPPLCNIRGMYVLKDDMSN